VPFFGPFTGAEALRQPFNRLIFHVRASYYDETALIVRQLTNLGLKKIAVFYQNDAYGKAGLDGVTKALADLKLAPVATATVERNTTDVKAAVDKLVPAMPDAVVQISSYGASAAFVRAARKAGFGGTFYNVSFVGTQALADELGKDGAGVVVSQVVPSPYQPSRQITREFLEAIKKGGDKVQANYSSLEGYLAARVFTEGLRPALAGGKLSHDSFIAGMESLGSQVISGFPVSFAARTTRHRVLWKCRCSPATAASEPDSASAAGVLSAQGARARQSLHERLAARQLFQAHKFIGLVRLLNAAGAAHHGGNAGVLEKAGLGAKGHQRGAFLAGELLRQARYGIVLAAQKTGDFADGLEAETCAGATVFMAGSSAWA
jgi:hypothetical protein